MNIGVQLVARNLILSYRFTNLLYILAKVNRLDFFAWFNINQSHQIVLHLTGPNFHKESDVLEDSKNTISR